MEETLMQQYHVSEEGLRVVKLCPIGRTALWLIPTMFDGTIEESTG